MSDPEDVLPKQNLVVMQILAGALLSGVAIFLAIVLIIVHGRNNGAGLAPPGDLPIISIVAVLFFVLQGPLAFIVPGIMTGNGLRKIASGKWQSPTESNPSGFATDSSKLLALRQSTLIVRLALLESAAFFGCVAFLLEGQLFVLSAVFVALFLMLASFPTYYRIRYWLQLQTDQLTQLRQQAAS
jgi:hypothetical protein